MTAREDEFRVRPGRVRDTRAPKPKGFIADVLRRAQKAGHVGGRPGARSGRSTFGRGRTAALAAGLRTPSRRVAFKARIARHRGPRFRSAPLAAHLAYLQRDGTTRSGEPARMFDAEGDAADTRAFAARSEEDRHHFRFIISPEDASELQDLRATTRDLMREMESDLGTRLDWVAVDHWNTDNPHVHVLVRGRDDRGKDLVISRDYISQGLRRRVEALVELELGPRSELEVRSALAREVAAERWTGLDRTLQAMADNCAGIVDLRPGGTADADPELRGLLLGRSATLEGLGLAEAAGPAQWTLKPDLEARLRSLGEQGDIIRTLHRALARSGVDRGSDLAAHLDTEAPPLVGRLVERGLHDELTGSAYVVIDGTDGRAHHVRLRDLDATSDAEPGAIVELRRFEDRHGETRTVLAVRSDLSLAAQITAPGATWLDRQLVAREPAPLSDAGFGQEVRAALDARTDHLTGEGLARRQRQRAIFARDLIETLRRRELDGVGKRLTAESGLAHRPTVAGDYVTGTYRRQITLSSGRFAVIDDGLGFQLVPWTPSLEPQLGRYVSGVAMPSGGVEWSFRRTRGIGL